MEEKIWRMGEYNKDTNLYFWAYQDRFHTKELWLSLEKFKEKKKKSLEYNRSKKHYYKSRYEKNKEVILSNSRKKYFERKWNAILLMLPNVPKVCLVANLNIKT